MSSTRRRWTICADVTSPGLSSVSWRPVNRRGSPIRLPGSRISISLASAQCGSPRSQPASPPEGALWGSVQAHGLLREIVIVSDDAGQFDVGHNALCWMHAERLVHKLDTFTDLHRTAQQRMSARSSVGSMMISRCIARHSLRGAVARLRARFDRIFHRRTGFVTLDRLLARLHANKTELLAVLDRPEILLHTNGSERDIRLHVMVELLCAPSLSVCKDWKCVLLSDATRASVSGDRCFD